MAAVTFQILDGEDKGQVFHDLPTPVTIGREEGNVVRLKDERASRFHAKIQFDDGEIILTDLESTNGTRVNGNVVQIRRLRPGDRVGIGRSLLLYGSAAEITARQAALDELQDVDVTAANDNPVTLASQALASQFDHDLNLDLRPTDKVRTSAGTLFINNRPLPPLPLKLTPAQAARLAEVIDFLHRHLTAGTENIQSNDDGTEVMLGYSDWQRVLGVQMLLARYVRAVTEPETIEG